MFSASQKIPRANLEMLTRINSQGSWPDLDVFEDAYGAVQNILITPWLRRLRQAAQERDLDREIGVEEAIEPQEAPEVRFRPDPAEWGAGIINTRKAAAPVKTTNSKYRKVVNEVFKVRLK